MEKVKEENIPCVACGRTDLPLHYNRRCVSCGVDDLSVKAWEWELGATNLFSVGCGDFAIAHGIREVKIARLIASAPQLLKLLRDVATAHNKEAEIDAKQAAIEFLVKFAKAEGRE